METVGERLDFIRKQKEKSYRELANLIGDITGDAVRKAIHGNRVKDYYVNIISEKLKINRRWILTGDGDPFEEDTSRYFGLSVTACAEDAYKTVEDAHIWLTKLQANEGFSSRDLGSIIGCTQIEFHDALRNRALSFDQIRTIARSKKALVDFDTTFNTSNDFVNDELRAYRSIKSIISKEVFKEVHSKMDAVLERIEEQNMTLTKIMLEMNGLRKQSDALTPSDGFQNEKALKK